MGFYHSIRYKAVEEATEKDFLKMQIVLSLLLFILWPFGSFIVSTYSLLNRKLSETNTIVCLFMLSLFWGLLAFTQKSLAAEDTDCIRYYEFFELFEGIEPLYAISSLNILELLNFVFMPASVLVIE